MQQQQQQTADSKGQPCVSITCKQCGDSLNSSHSLIVHYCRKGKQLTAAHLGEVAAAAGKEAILDGRCFLCHTPVAEDQPHMCRCMPWSLLVAERSHLQANSVRVLLHDDMHDFRQRCHVIMHNYFL
jgi:hypothetical protein